MHASRRTLKYMMGILHGTWIVGDSWVAACAAAGNPVPEDSHEVKGDSNGNLEGPILGRMQKSEKLLRGWEVIPFPSSCCAMQFQSLLAPTNKMERAPDLPCSS